jgi:hypothetical protein
MVGCRQKAEKLENAVLRSAYRREVERVAREPRTSAAPSEGADSNVIVS